MIINSPVLALPTPPETGASKNLIFLFLSICPNVLVSVGLLEDISIKIEFNSFFNNSLVTSETTFPFGSIKIITSRLFNSPISLT